MKRPVKGHLIIGEERIEVLGMIADDLHRQQEVGHVVVKEMTPILLALGNQTPVKLDAEPHPPVAITFTLLDLFTKTARFRVNA